MTALVWKRFAFLVVAALPSLLDGRSVAGTPAGDKPTIKTVTLTLRKPSYNQKSTYWHAQMVYQVVVDSKGNVISKDATVKPFDGKDTSLISRRNIRFKTVEPEYIEEEGEKTKCISCEASFRYEEENHHQFGIFSAGNTAVGGFSVRLRMVLQENTCQLTVFPPLSFSGATLRFPQNDGKVIYQGKIPNTGFPGPTEYEILLDRKTKK